MNCMTRLPALLVLMCCVHAAAQDVGTDTIGGALPKVVRNTGRPYVVVSDIEVPPDRLVTIEAGVVFLFRAFTGLHVQGRLDVLGTESAPAVFTSENDQTYNPSSVLMANPYDWNGIYVHAGALGCVFEHVKVTYSVYGLLSETKFIRVEPGVFIDNGKSNLVIEGRELVISREPVSHVLSMKDATIDGVSVKILKDPAAPRRNAFRYAGLGLFVAGTAVAVIEGILAGTASEELRVLSNASTSTVDGVDNLRYGSGEAWEEADSRRSWNTFGCVVGSVAGLVGVFGFVWSFTF